MSTSASDAAKELYWYIDREKENARVDVVRGLTQRQGDAESYRDPWGYTAVSKAAYHGNTEVLEYLLSLPPCQRDIAYADRYGRMPIHWAAQEGHPECVRVLLEHGATPNHRNNSGKTPLDLAREGNKQNVVELLENPTPPLHWSRELHLKAGPRVRESVMCTFTLGYLSGSHNFTGFVLFFELRRELGNGAFAILVSNMLNFLPLGDYLLLANAEKNTIS